MANTRQQSITIDNTKVISDVTGMQLLVTRTELNNEIVDPSGSNRAKADGGDLRFYLNSNQTGRLNLEVITFEYDTSTGAGDAKIQLRCSDPSWVVSSTVDTVIYVEYGDAALTQPATSAVFGRDDTWQSKKIVHHLESLTAVDSTGNGNNGTSNGVIVTGKIGNGQDFNGANQQVAIGSTVYILKATPYHISAWIASDITDNDVMLSLASDAAAGWQIFTNSSGSYTQFTFGSSSAEWVNLRASGLILNDYTKLDIAFDGVDAADINSFTVYINGQSVTISTAAAMGGVAQSNNIANTGGGGGLAYAGEIDEIMVGQIEPTAAFVSTSFNNEDSPSTFMTAGTPIPVSSGGVSITGTAVPTQTEADIVTGGKTIILTLSGDTFVTGTSSEDGIAGGSDSDKTGANKWDALIKSTLDNADVVLSVGDTVATITLPAFATYDTAETETITWTIPAASLTTGTSDIIATPTHTVTAVVSGFQVAWARSANVLIQ
jgi:hypothetical protein